MAASSLARSEKDESNYRLVPDLSAASALQKELEDEMKTTVQSEIMLLRRLLGNGVVDVTSFRERTQGAWEMIGVLSSWPWTGTLNSWTVRMRILLPQYLSVTNSILFVPALLHSLPLAQWCHLWFCTLRWPLSQMNFWAIGWVISLGPLSFPSFPSFSASVPGHWIWCGKGLCIMEPLGKSLSSWCCFRCAHLSPLFQSQIPHEQIPDDGRIQKPTSSSSGTICDLRVWHAPKDGHTHVIVRKTWILPKGACSLLVQTVQTRVYRWSQKGKKGAQA